MDWRYHRKPPIIVFIGVLFLVLYVLFFIKGNDHTDNDHKQNGPAEISLTENEISQINKDVKGRDKGRYHRKPNLLWWSYEGGRIDRDIVCGTLECRSTINRDYRHDVDTKVFMFYGSTFELQDVPLPRKKHELWLLKHEESPKNNDYLFSHIDIMTLFNYTSTFKRQSHYPISTQYLPSLDYLKSKQFLIATDKKNELQNNEDLAPVLYIQSDCNPPSDRDTYVKLLQKYIKVDSYGLCEHNKDLPEHLQFVKSMAGMHHDDFFKLCAKYKFTLSMENAICDDYITEKIWRPLHVGSVPIIFSSPFIREFLPNNESALVITDYQSVEDLANVIKNLNSNDHLYQKFLRFKEEGGIDNSLLVSHMNSREWGEFPKRFVDHFDGFECFACRKAHELLVDLENNREPETSVATLEHYGCPTPKLFDSEGKYVIESKDSNEPYLFSKYMARAFRNGYNKHIQLKDKYLRQQAKYLRSKSGE